MGILTLQDLEVLYVGIFSIDVELNPGHGKVSENAVKHLAESSSAS